MLTNGGCHAPWRGMLRVKFWSGPNQIAKLTRLPNVSGKKPYPAQIPSPITDVKIGKVFHMCKSFLHRSRVRAYVEKLFHIYLRKSVNTCRENFEPEDVFFGKASNNLWLRFQPRCGKNVPAFERLPRFFVVVFESAKLLIPGLVAQVDRATAS